MKDFNIEIYIEKDIFNLGVQYVRLGTVHNSLKAWFCEFYHIHWIVGSYIKNSQSNPQVLQNPKYNVFFTHGKKGDSWFLYKEFSI